MEKLNKIEVSGRTVEEAVQLAAQKMNVSTDAVEYEVVQEPTKGFLGLGQVPAVIKAWKKEEVEPGYEFGQSIERLADEESVNETSAEKTADIESSSDIEYDSYVSNLMKIITEVLSAMQVDARPVVRSASSEEVVIDIVGEDVALLIGKHGQTLDALQYLMAIAANKSSSERRRVILDAENYRNRHQEILERKAREYAKAVAREGKEAVLEPQSARDRRIIHLALANHPDVYTYSEGEGDERHVVISPKK